MVATPLLGIFVAALLNYEFDSATEGICLHTLPNVFVRLKIKRTIREVTVRDLLFAIIAVIVTKSHKTNHFS